MIVVNTAFLVKEFSFLPSHGETPKMDDTMTESYCLTRVLMYGPKSKTGADIVIGKYQYSFIVPYSNNYLTTHVIHLIHHECILFVFFIMNLKKFFTNNFCRSGFLVVFVFLLFYNNISIWFVHIISFSAVFPLFYRCLGPINFCDDNLYYSMKLRNFMMTMMNNMY